MLVNSLMSENDLEWNDAGWITREFTIAIQCNK